MSFYKSCAVLPRLQVNGQLCFRCVGQSQMSLLFSCQRETARFNVGLNPDIEPRAIEEGVCYIIIHVIRHMLVEHSNTEGSFYLCYKIQSFPQICHESVCFDINL